MIIKLIAVTCMLFTPLALVAIPTAVPLGISVSPHYALDFAGGRPGYLDYKSDELTYFTFYTFFKCGVDPDCIDTTYYNNGEINENDL